MIDPDFRCFDGPAFLESIDEKRREQGLSWPVLGRLTGVSPSTIKRFATGEKIEADGVLALLRWLGRPLGDFSPANSHLNSGVAPTPAAPGTMLRRDTSRLHDALMRQTEQNGESLSRLPNYLNADFHALTRTTNFQLKLCLVSTFETVSQIALKVKIRYHQWHSIIK